MNEKTIQFVYRLKRTMELQGMRQVDLAKKTGLSKATISQYLSAKCMPKSDRIFLLAQALNVTPEYLLGFQPAQSGTQALVDYYNLLSPSKKQEVLRYVKFIAQEELENVQR